MRGLVFLLLLPAACVQRVNIGSQNADGGVDTRGPCPAGERECPCEGCTPAATECRCSEPPLGCTFVTDSLCTECAEAIQCPESCDDVLCEAGTRCCPCNGCVLDGDACPGRPPWCTIGPGCRLEGSSECNCGRHICPGECDEFPGGECDPEEWCDFRSDCQAVGGAMCEPRPSACSPTCETVCGCDGQEYCNACEASMAGIDVMNAGACS